MSAVPASAADAVFAGLEPAIVWKHFATLCAIPRMSKHEGELREHLRAWAVTRGLPAQVDATGNLIIRKPASAGCERAPTVVLQAHLDMVCQKNSDSPHDFTRDPIVPVREDGWIRALDTTLGADNGIGVSLIVATLEDASLVHGPIEALLTIDEETGMTGAQGLSGEVLTGRLMLNLDTEEWGEIYLGCAGGVDVNVHRGANPQAQPVDTSLVRIDLRGLRGGHSGTDIHEERGNAIKLLVRALRELERIMPVRLAALQGGTARNALAREASARIALPVSELEILPGFLAHLQDLLRHELRGVDEGLTLSATALEGHADVLPAAEQEVWLATLHAAPHGVHRMSRQVPGVVETSNNLGVVDLQATGGTCNFMVRSLLDEGCQALAAEIASLWSLSGTHVAFEGAYPGWTPDPGSRLLQVVQQVYREEFHGESQVKVVHAGLECGILGSKYPGIDIVSFGPTIRGAHAPGEGVEIDTVGHCRVLLNKTLERLARA